MKVGDLVCTLEDWDRIGLIMEVMYELRYPEAKIIWTDGTIEVWCVKELVTR